MNLSVVHGRATEQTNGKTTNNNMQQQQHNSSSSQIGAQQSRSSTQQFHNVEYNYTNDDSTPPRMRREKVIGPKPKLDGVTHFNIRFTIPPKDFNCEMFVKLMKGMLN